MHNFYAYVNMSRLYLNSRMSLFDYMLPAKTLHFLNSLEYSLCLNVQYFLLNCQTTVELIDKE